MSRFIFVSWLRSCSSRGLFQGRRRSGCKFDVTPNFVLQLFRLALSQADVGRGRLAGSTHCFSKREGDFDQSSKEVGNQLHSCNESQTLCLTLLSFTSWRCNTSPLLPKCLFRVDCVLLSRPEQSTYHPVTLLCLLRILDWP